ncbi:hypothetical protein SLEP1_g55487 [Rubroshorea leprosula]|uniref:Uncharacterized protein n=1 Tax=Rubroshorea leprosula TaxID=152421 RepID=A0AAV5MFG8_9ROSI|nr:hypothetical protein SLEP1_g55487 [Rubroshorea leprosula]
MSYPIGVGHDNWKTWVREGRGVGSSWWKDICRIDVLVENKKGWLSDGFEVLVGDGGDLSFWRDLWCGEEVLANKFPRLYLLSTGTNNKIRQMGAWIDGKWCWMLPWRRNLLSWELQSKEELEKLLDSVKLHEDRKDKWLWKHGKDGDYSTRSCIDYTKENWLGGSMVCFDLDNLAY